VTQLADVPCAVNGDRILLQQVVVNLVVNAMDAMATVDRSERQVIVRSAIDRRGLLFTVTDRGTGLDEAVLARLFEPFVTTKPTGIGIGLTITSAIIEAHGGRIEAHNNSEAGATFSVLLPAIAADLVTDVAVQQGGAATSSGAATPMSVD